MKNNYPDYIKELEVAFSDLDPMGIVWHGNYLKYFDYAREGLLKSLNVNLFQFFVETGYAFPVIRSNIKYISPLKYGDIFLCQATLIEWRRKITMEFEIRRKKDNCLCATGRGEQAAVKAPEMKLEYIIPEELQKLFSLGSGKVE